MARVEIPAGEFGALDRYWPPVGLQHLDAEPGEPDLFLSLRSAGSGPIAVVGGVEVPGGWDRIESDLALFAATHLSERVAVHGGLVRLGDAAALLPGASHAGKSNLCLAAHRAGAEVLTDELVLVDPVSGLVEGWRRPVRIRAGAQGLVRHDIAVEHGATRVAVVALLRYDPERGTSWSPIPVAEALLGVLANTVCARTRPDDSLDAALAVVRPARTVGGTRGDAAGSVGPLLALLAADDCRQPPT